MNPKQAYAGILPAEPMVIPRNTVLLLYSPTGVVSATMTPRRGQAPWIFDFNGLGVDTVLPVDGNLWGLAQSVGAGSVSYVYFPRDLAQAIRLDTVSPLLTLLPVTITANGGFRAIGIFPLLGTGTIGLWGPASGPLTVYRYLITRIVIIAPSGGGTFSLNTSVQGDANIPIASSVVLAPGASWSLGPEPGATVVSPGLYMDPLDAIYLTVTVPNFAALIEGYAVPF